MNNIEKLFNRFPKGEDALLITSDVNRRYFSGMKSSAGVIAVFKEKAYLLIDFRYFEKASATVTDCEVILLENLKAQLSDLFRKHNAKNVMIDSENMTVAELNSYKKRFPDINFNSSDDFSNLIKSIRTIKTEKEIEKIITAQKIAEEAFYNVLDFIRPGRTEKEIEFQLNSYMLSHGAEALSFDTIALSGENTSLPHGVPSERKVNENEFVLMDFGAVYEGYHSDMTRTVCVGEPTEDMLRIYTIVKEAQEASFSVLKAGLPASDLDLAARDVIDSYGYGDYFGHSLGHGVGMDIHEHPFASPNSPTILEENMVVTVEPGIYLPKQFGVRIENFTAVKKDGFQQLTSITNELIKIK